MKLNKSIILAGTALAGLFMTSAALAQSTATQEIETKVIVKGAKKASAAGLGVEQTVTKTRSTITAEALDASGPGSPLATLNLLPGVNFNDQDATGSVGFDITLRGFDSQRIALILDGMPLNDTGNYAIYPTMNIDSELYSRVDVNLGSTDVDSPTAAAGGGTINFSTKKPADKMGFEIKESFGDNDYHRDFFRADSGKFGPWGTTAYVTYSNLFSDKWKGPGTIKRQQWNAGLYQPIGDNGDFVSASLLYNHTRNNTYYSGNLADVTANYAIDYADTISATSGTATGSGSGAFYNWKINPTNNGNLRIQSKFHLKDNLVLTIDPSFQYTLADGGSQVFLLTEKTGAVGSQVYTQLINFDANHDGTIGTEYVFNPSLTRTLRYTVNSSLIWYINPDNTLRIAYTYDRGNHRQNGPMNFLNTSDMTIYNVFGLDKDHQVIGSDGKQTQRRNRQSYAELNQIAITYGGYFFNDALKVDIGLRIPEFKRDLNNYCFQNGTTAYCEPTLPTTLTTAQKAAYLAATSWKVTYTKYLPNLGVSFKVDDHQTIYSSYSEMVSAPRTDSLYSSPIPSLEPELSKSFDVGYRYSSPVLSASVALWKTDFAHRIETGYDVDLDASVATDVGNVKESGANAEIGYRPLKGLSIYASASYTHTEMQSDYQSAKGANTCATAGVFFTGTWDCTKGHALGKVPRLMYTLSADYKIGDWQFGLNGKFTGNRYVSLQNVAVAPAYTVWNGNVKYKIGKFGPLKESYLQLNVRNLGGTKYITQVSPGNAFFDGSAASGAFYYMGQPRSAMLTVDTKF